MSRPSKLGSTCLRWKISEPSIADMVEMLTAF
jgi:hypothetical protein